MSTIASVLLAWSLLAGSSDPVQTSQRNYGKLDTKAVEIVLRSRVPVVVIDSRKPRYDDGKRIPGGKLLSPTADTETITKMIPSKDALIITYCSHIRCPLSHELAERLIQLGYRNVLVYPYGLKGWVAGGNKTVKEQ